MGYIKNLLTSKEKLVETIASQEEMMDNLYELLDTKKSEADKLQDIIRSKNREIIKLKKPRKRTRKQLSHRTGFTKVSDVESLEMFDMYNNQRDLVDIASYFKRSQSCVGTHIRKHLEE